MASPRFARYLRDARVLTLPYVYGDVLRGATFPAARTLVPLGWDAAALTAGLTRTRFPNVTAIELLSRPTLPAVAARFPRWTLPLTWAALMDAADPHAPFGNTMSCVRLSSALDGAVAALAEKPYGPMYIEGLGVVQLSELTAELYAHVGTPPPTMTLL